MILTWVFRCIGVALMIYSGPSLYHWYEARLWPEAKGRIIASEVISAETDESKRAAIRYKYRVGKKKFENDVIQFGYVGSTEQKEHSDLVKKFPKKKRVAVFYNPEKPQQAVLIKDPNWLQVALFLLGFLIATSSPLDRARKH